MWLNQFVTIVALLRKWRDEKAIYLLALIYLQYDLEPSFFLAFQFNWHLFKFENSFDQLLELETFTTVGGTGRHALTRLRVLCVFYCHL